MVYQTLCARLLSSKVCGDDRERVRLCEREDKGALKNPPALGDRAGDDEIGQQRHAKITTFAAVTVAEFVVLSPPQN